MTSSRVLPLVSVIIPNRNGAAYLEDCLRSLLLQTYARVEIIVVDNASQDASVEIVQRLAPQAALVRETRNLGFAGGANAGFRVAHGDWIAILNNDTEVSVDWLGECMAAADRHPEAAFLACRILHFRERTRLYSAGDCFLRAGIGYRRGQEQADRKDYQVENEVFSACGCAALYRRAVLDAVGAYDNHFFAYLEDVDLGLRLQTAGHRGYYVPKAEVYHHGGGTSGGEFSPLAVRLRTRNSLLLLVKSMPANILLRCAPMILTAQLFWLARVLANMRLWSYLRGLAGAALLMPAMIDARRQERGNRSEYGARLWQAIERSEAAAREDFLSEDAEQVSVFLKWYFRVF